jgi:uncharacterized coiled-coil DUF342 family protein
MTEPHQFSLEALLAEDGQCVRAGLPESLRRDLEKLKVIKNRAELVQAKREQLEQLLANINEHQTRLVELHEELRKAMTEYTTLTTDNSAV